MAQTNRKVNGVARIISLFILFLLPVMASAQRKLIPYTKGDSLTITLLAIEGTPGLTTAFGHTVFRVKNHTKKRDDLVDFAGRTNWDAIEYISSFLFGDLYYDIYTYKIKFLYRQDHTVDELFLKLTPAQKEKLMDILSGGFFMEDGGQYKYDYIYRNCSTLVRDVLEDVYGPGMTYPDLGKENQTFREVYAEGLVSNPWIKFFSDIILGPFSDRVVTPREQMFIPVTLYEYLKGARVNGELIAKNHILLLKGSERKPISFFEKPGLYVWGFLILEVLLVFLLLTGRISNRWVVVYDRVWFFFATLMSFLIIGLWLTSNYDYAAKDNWNLLWLNPLYLILLISPRLRGSKVTQATGVIIIVCTLIAVLGWSVIPQSFNIYFLPLMLLYILKVGKYMISSKYLNR